MSILMKKPASDTISQLRLKKTNEITISQNPTFTKTR